MKLNRQKKSLVLSVLVLGLVAWPVSADSLWGAAAAKADGSLGIQDMLIYAIQDEYLARAEYVVIQATLGVQRPFSNIQQAESRHVQWLEEQFAAYGFQIPADTAAQLVHAPATLAEAYAAGVQAEVENIAMYEGFLAQPAMAETANQALRGVFVELRDASKNHLAAFQRQQAR